MEPIDVVMHFLSENEREMVIDLFNDESFQTSEKEELKTAAITYKIGDSKEFAIFSRAQFDEFVSQLKKITSNELAD